MIVVHENISGSCPGGFCDYLIQFSEVLTVLLIADGFIFLVTLIPPLFTWKNKKPDSKKRIFFAVFACLTFYFWLAILAISSLYCFGFLAHAGPCNSTAPELSSNTLNHLPLQTPNDAKSVLENSLLVRRNSGDEQESMVSCISHTENSLKKITLVNCLIIIILLLVVAANINEVFQAKALYYQETLCRKEDIQKFLSSLVSKKPEVGHLVKCFHVSKSADAKTNSGHKVVTYSTVENFEFQTWKDFSDLRLIEPSREYPVIEVEIVLNFFPGDQSTAENYKQFVQKLTKAHSGKDTKISIDDYFHIEDQKEWTFFIGNKNYISPWWEKGPARIFLSCILLFGWPARFSYKGKVAKHRIEVKKAVFVETSSQDEGVSLTATPGSSLDGCHDVAKPAMDSNPPSPSVALSPTFDDKSYRTGDNHNHEQTVDVQLSNSSLSHSTVTETRVSASVKLQHNSTQLDDSTPLLNRQHRGNTPLHSTGRQRDGNSKDVVTAVTHHDINGMNTVSTVAVKDVDVQMTSLSGYETYV